MSRPEIIVSSGQAGSERGGLLAAQQLGIMTGGWTAKGSPMLETFDLMEHDTIHDAAPRHEANVRLADATVLFGPRTKVTNLIERMCNRYTKPLLWVPDPLEHKQQLMLRLWLVKEKPKILFVSGDSEVEQPGIEGTVEQVLVQVLHE